MLRSCRADCHPTPLLPVVTAPVAVPDAVAGDAVLSGVHAALYQEALVMEPLCQWLLVAVAAPVPWRDAPKLGQAGESWTNVGASGMDQGPMLQSHPQVCPLCWSRWGDAGGG